MLSLTFIGWRRGLLRQVLGWVALLVAASIAPSVAGYVRPTLQGAGYTAGSVEVASLLMGFSVAFFGLWLVQLWIPDKIRDWSLPAKKIDGVFGAALAALKAMAICWLLISCVLLLENDLVRRTPALKAPLASSQIVAQCRRYNPVAEWGLTDLARLRALLASGPREGANKRAPTDDAVEPAGVDAEAIEPAAKMKGGDKQGKVSRLMRQLRKDPRIQRLARSKQWGRLLADPRVQRLLADQRGSR